jgi:hypothetical protein
MILGSWMVNIFPNILDWFNIDMLMFEKWVEDIFPQQFNFLPNTGVSLFVVFFWLC